MWNGYKEENLFGIHGNRNTALWNFSTNPKQKQSTKSHVGEHEATLDSYAGKMSKSTLVLQQLACNHNVDNHPRRTRMAYSIQGGCQKIQFADTHAGNKRAM
jgi:hypothetical protein